MHAYELCNAYTYERTDVYPKPSYFLASIGKEGASLQCKYYKGARGA